MRDFEQIHTDAIALHDADGVTASLPEPLSSEELAQIGDDRYLSLMSLRIFRAGLKHAMVDAKWPTFEEVFFRFDPASVAAMADETLESLAGDARLIRHWGKLQAVRTNAQTMIEINKRYGGFGNFINVWPGNDTVGLCNTLQKQFRQLGGSSAANFLRMAGKDTYLLTKDVVTALKREGVCEAEPKSLKAKKQVQEAFNLWAQQSELPLCQISKILALSVG